MKDKKLTRKQQLFIKYYAQSRNASDAVIRAGYITKNPNTIGNQNLTKLHEEIQIEFDKINQKVELTQERIVKELELIAFSDIKDFLDIDGKGDVKLKAFDEMKADISRAISQISKDKSRRLRYRLHDKLKALELLGKYKKMFTENINISGTLSIVNVEKKLDDYLKKQGEKGLDGIFSELNK